MQNNIEVSVIGGGSFGTVLASVLSENTYSPKLWLRDAGIANAINQHQRNEKYLPGFTLHSNICATTDMALALRNADIVFFSLPSKVVRHVAQSMRPLLKPDAIIVTTTKGIEEHSFLLMSQVLQQELPEHEIAALSGPNIAREILAKQLSVTVVANSDIEVCERVAQVLHNHYLRVYRNEDIFGVELGGALKNIYAIMSGYADGLALGDNTKSMLLTRALAEMSRFALELGANPLTFIGLAGIGDLLVTCMSPLSRNYKVGQALAKGMTLEQAVASLGQVAEGVNTLRIVYQKSQMLGVYMPLVEALQKLLFEQAELDTIIDTMMQRQRNSDVEFTFRKK